MADVIDFPVAENHQEEHDIVWECGCGCQLFYVCADGLLCANCNKFADFENA